MTKEFLLHKDRKRKPTAHSGTFVFARHKSQHFAKPKEPSFCRPTDRPLIIQTLFILKNAILKIFDYFSGLIILTK